MSDISAISDISTIYIYARIFTISAISVIYDTTKVRLNRMVRFGSRSVSQTNRYIKHVVLRNTLTQK